MSQDGNYSRINEKYIGKSKIKLALGVCVLLILGIACPSSHDKLHGGLLSLTASVSKEGSALRLLSTPRLFVEGRVLHMRSLGKKLAFLDVNGSVIELERPGNSSDAVLEVERLQVVAQNDEKLAKEIKQIKRGAKVRLCVMGRPAREIPEDYHRRSFILKAVVSVVNASANETRAVAAPWMRHLKICRWFWRGKTCPMGDSCGRRHHFVTAKEEKLALSTRHAFEQKRAHVFNEHNHTRQLSGRGSVMGDWLVREYGATFLNSGSGVVEVAGGKQFLSMYLSLKYGIRCTVVDPRRQEPLLVQADELVLRARGIAAPQYHMAEFNSDFVSKHSDHLKTCSIIVGQHPDEATEPIVVQARNLGKPFAVVPCCVFSKLFPRQLPDGRAVTTTSQLITYLSLMSDNVLQAKLALDGANTVLYTDPRHVKQVAFTNSFVVN